MFTLLLISSIFAKQKCAHKGYGETQAADIVPAAYPTSTPAPTQEVAPVETPQPATADVPLAQATGYGYPGQDVAPVKKKCVKKHHPEGYGSSDAATADAAGYATTTAADASYPTSTSTPEPVAPVPVVTTQAPKPAYTPVEKPKPVRKPKAVEKPKPKPAPVASLAQNINVPKNMGAHAALSYASQQIKLPNSGNFQQDCLSIHNTYRGLMNKAPLSWSSKLESAARNWANNLAASNSFEHSGMGYGENLYQCTNGKFTCAEAVKAWFDEYKVYNGEPVGQGDFHAYGHFTQLMWPNTQQVGCAAAKRGSTQTTVCEYEPAGNYMGQSVSMTSY